MTTTKTAPGRLPRLLYTSSYLDTEYGGREEVRTPVTDIDDALLVSSEIGKGIHAPVLDLDVPHDLVSSSTPGHSHLYIDMVMSWRRYKRLLKALGRAGIIERGYVKASIARKHTAVRLPWVKK